MYEINDQMSMWMPQCFCKALERFCGETTRLFISAGEVTVSPHSKAPCYLLPYILEM